MLIASISYYMLLCGTDRPTGALFKKIFQIILLDFKYYESIAKSWNWPELTFTGRLTKEDTTVESKS